ncbi:PREDICTED: F-box/kelch-repeat protein At5g60570-like isoform X1 [Nelumbo nucifera]|uniref:F-box/kelch-repeat protein At5g60570-like isoform X1 n=3 Tax=Nelumbo nucifera TaxID=4432 RepID=A0A1U8A1P6_NELNU|nr:PREDICTED: F-box/kelch-repeat protein At5g60570-like isoform X1 [Nelumbo nucifera]XP_019053472.1 PREDICTED: F-box/kelch-repeat protein At5g60570-like isoform X1 [Nelumbo nucifera]DAD43561.1 TPA_asm: hypothetical protein HUJ06_001791 [Nelumbo nucifera]
MVFRYFFDELKRNKDEVKRNKDIPDLPAMVGAQGCVIPQLRTSFNCGSESFQINWYLLGCMLLARNKNLTSDDILDKGTDMPSLDPIKLKKMKHTVTEHSGDKTGRASDDSFLPGLNDDMVLDILAWTSRADYPSLACVNRKFKSLVSSGYLYKLRRHLGVIEHWVYLACISMPWEAFDPVRCKWMRLPALPCDVCFSSADKESLAVGTQLLVFGQELTGFAIWKYSLITHEWSRCPLMNLSRCLFGSSSHGEIAIIAGGSDKDGNALKSAEFYNSELGVWKNLPDMNLPRKMCSGFFMDGKFYVIGGVSGSESLTCGEEYNIETRTWRRINDMYPCPKRPLQCPPLVAVVNNQLYAADQTTNEVKKYNKMNNTWSVVGRLPLRADSNNGWGLAFRGCGDKLLVVGGQLGCGYVVLHYWCPEDGNNGETEWKVLSVRERSGAFVCNCAVMSC